MVFQSLGAGAVARSTAMEREQELVSRIRTGDVGAFEILYREFAPGLLAFAFTHVRSREIAEELVQELFLNLWKYRQKWVLTHSLKAYLFGALRKRITSYQRTAAARHEMQPTSADTAAWLSTFPGTTCADDRVREVDLLAAIDRAVAALPHRCRETFLLVRQQRLSYAEAAEVLGVSVKAVEMNMVRAFAALRRSLADWRG